MKGKERNYLVYLIHLIISKQIKMIINLHGAPNYKQRKGCKILKFEINIDLEMKYQSNETVVFRNRCAFTQSSHFWTLKSNSTLFLNNFLLDIKLLNIYIKNYEYFD